MDRLKDPPTWLKVATTQEIDLQPWAPRQWTSTITRWRCGLILLPSLTLRSPHPQGDKIGQVLRQYCSAYSSQIPERSHENWGSPSIWKKGWHLRDRRRTARHEKSSADYVSSGAKDKTKRRPHTSWARRCGPWDVLRSPMSWRVLETAEVGAGDDVEVTLPRQGRNDRGMTRTTHLGRLDVVGDACKIW